MGSQYIAVLVSIEMPTGLAVASQDWSYDEFRVRVGGMEYGPAAAYADVSEAAFGSDAGPLPLAGTVTAEDPDSRTIGWVTFEVPLNAEALEIAYGDGQFELEAQQQSSGTAARPYDQALVWHDLRSTSAWQAALATPIPSATPSPATPSPEPTQDTAAIWLDIELTNAVTGDTFTLASLSGQVVAVEPMAIWCTNCRKQQDNVKKIYAELADMGVHYISLGVDPSENKEALAKYAERRGYDWQFAQSNVEFSRALADLFGPQILSAPSTPLIVLDENGDVFAQEFGFHGPDRLIEILETAVGQ